ncbi:FecR domain-containing protein [Tamlana sp. 2201CG12-4]|uniref:FecR family protein n=1 Tax=Tamlana sp. 2201CG12-4 TaxID=3112582 RepID=UPI002DB5A6E6|nr:FecR domain-containing protein [Tamlana sp. 2201CG12-4]MEC3907873.1 FecR domain-containing protein [Tamlana sp. 2201CG12-4]
MKTLIHKFIDGTISAEELLVLHEKLKDEHHQNELKSFVRDNYDLNLALIQSNIDDAYKKVTHAIKDQQPSRPLRKLVPNWVKYAAVAVVFIAVGYIYQQNSQSLKSQVPVTIVPGEEPITLELDNGKIITLDLSQNKVVADSKGKVIGKQNEDQLNYSSKSDASELVYNTLKVPYGKQFELVLSDGTKVFLNAGTELRYPVSFIKGQDRLVYLESGEVFMDVTQNKAQPFIVNTDGLNIEVLGTEFNVSSYPEDKDIAVVLVEGLVGLTSKKSAKKDMVKLIPGQLGAVNRASQEIEVEKVNINIYTAWMSGHLFFRNESFDNILTKLERHYNVEIENENAELGKIHFDASFNKIEIDSVLSFFNDSYKIDYTIENNKVYIK